MNVIVADIRRDLASWQKSRELLKAEAFEDEANTPLRGLVFCRASVKAARARKASGIISYVSTVTSAVKFSVKNQLAIPGLILLQLHIASDIPDEWQRISPSALLE